jgi:hypothetical protein
MRTMCGARSIVVRRSTQLASRHAMPRTAHKARFAGRCGGAVGSGTPRFAYKDQESGGRRGRAALRCATAFQASRTISASSGVTSSTLPLSIDTLSRSPALWTRACCVGGLSSGGRRAPRSDERGGDGSCPTDPAYRAVGATRLPPSTARRDRRRGIASACSHAVTRAPPKDRASFGTTTLSVRRMPNGERMG